MVDNEQIMAVYETADLLHSAADVANAYDRMAEEITAKLSDANPLVMCIMTGGLVPSGQILPRLGFPLEVDYIHATRYAGKISGGELDWKVRPSQALYGRVILLIDDIHDEGLTLAAITNECKSAGASKVYSAVLVNKIHERKNNTSATFVGLDVEDRYVFGCGMDYKGYWRNAPGIYAVKGA